MFYYESWRFGVDRRRRKDDGGMKTKEPKNISLRDLGGSVTIISSRCRRLEEVYFM